MPNFRRTGKFVSVAALAASTALSGPIAALAQDRGAVRYAQAEPTAEELLLQQAPAEEAPAEEAAPVEEPAAEEPPAEEPPVVEEPVAEEPAAEPVVEEPVAEEPVTEPAPPAEEPAPVEPPVAEEPPAEPEALAAEPAAEPVVEEPVAEEPIAEPEAPVAEPAAESTVEEPVVDEPAAAEPAAEAPAPVEAPVAEEPPVEPEALAAEPAAEPVAEEPVAEEPVTEPEAPVAEPAAEPAVEEPVLDEPAAAEPAAEEAPAPVEAPVAEEPAAAPATEPVVEEPVAEEPVTEPEALIEEPAAAEQPAVEAPPVGEPALSPEAEEQLRMLAPGGTQPQSPQQPAAPSGEPAGTEPTTEGAGATAPETPDATTTESQTTTMEAPAAGTMVAPNEEVGATQAVTIDSSEVQENNLSITDARVQTFNTNNITVNSVTSVEGDRIEIEPEYELPDDAEVVERVGDREILTILGAGVAGAVAGGLAGYFIQSNDDERLAIGAEETYYEELPNGRFRETIVRPNGVQVVTITNEYGDIVQRSRILPDGREVVLFYDPFVGEYEREFYYADVGADLPPLEIAIPEEEYIVDITEPNEEIYYETIIAPPVETVERIYSVAEVRRSERIRNKVRRIDLSAINFEFGSATITQEEVADLQALAEAVARVVEDNPGETFLIEGHTDAVGSEIANLALSDRRAEAVAIALTEYFDIPPENLITQGYGESDLKVQTQEPNRENRRVTVRRITPLVKPVNTAQAN